MFDLQKVSFVHRECCSSWRSHYRPDGAKQAFLFHITMGHDQWNSHFHRPKLVWSSLQSPPEHCGQTKTVEHVLLECLMFHQLWAEHWHMDTYPHNKQAGLNELLDTGTYIQNTRHLVKYNPAYRRLGLYGGYPLTCK
ncbi:hypothetical protein BsWGS_24427 [Bradybaena similaris]